MSADTSILEMVPFESAEVTIHSLDHKRNFVRRIYRGNIKSKLSSREPKLFKSTKVKIGDMEEPVYHQRRDKELVWEVTPSKPDTSRTRWKHIYLPTWRLYVDDDPYSFIRYQETRMANEKEFDWDIFLVRNLNNLWSNYSNEILNEVQTIQEKGLAKILRHVLDITTKKTPHKKSKKLDSKTVYDRVTKFLSRQGSGSLLKSLDKFEKAYTSSSQLKRVVDEINSIEQQIEKAKASRNKLEELIRKMFTGNKDVAFKDTGSIEVKTDYGEEIDLRLLSSGEKHTLSIFIETLLTGPHTLLIDEPEMSLHIDWQKHLISSMHQLNPSAQLIFATHSPDIMSDVDDNNIFHL